jgi:PDZ domain-containing protein
VLRVVRRLFAGRSPRRAEDLSYANETASHVLDRARQGLATIVAIYEAEPPTRSAEGDPVFDFDLDVRLSDGSAPYRVRVAERVPNSMAVSPTPGMVVDVRVNPNDPNGVAIMWDLSPGKPAVGLEARRVPPEWAARLGISGGVEVGRVYPASAAERSGLWPGDVISEVDGIMVADMNDVAAGIHRRPPGSTAELTVWRAGRRMPVLLTIPE